VPILHLLAGPNGSGKSTFVARALQPASHLQFVNADLIAAERWPESRAVQLEHAYDASRAASDQRADLLSRGESFITETVFSHSSKLDLVHEAQRLGYLVHLHAIMLPVDVAVARVFERVQHGGHDVPEPKIRARYDRLWGLIANARDTADRTDFYDNSSAARPFRAVAEYEQGILIGEATWPSWAPVALTG